MKRSGEITIAAILLGLIVGGCVISSLAGYSWTLNDKGLKVGNPVHEAQATRVAMEANDEAAARQVERKAAQAAAPALALRNALAAMGSGVGILVIAIGVPLVVIAWAGKRAMTVYPNSAGQYPVIERHLWNGITIMHDPNRALGPTTIYTTPSLVSTLINALLAARGMKLLEANAQFPQPGSEQAMVQITSQAQLGQVEAANTRWPNLQIAMGHKGMTSSNRRDALPVVVDPADRIPQITRVDDPVQIAQFRELVEAQA